MATDAHQEVVGFDVAMDEVLAVQILEATNHLVDQHQHRFESEMTRAETVDEKKSRGAKISHYVVKLRLHLVVFSSFFISN